MDQTKELNDESIREQLSDYSDLIAPWDMAPPTVQHMQWKESGASSKLFVQPCSSVAAPQIKEVQRISAVSVYDVMEKMQSAANITLQLLFFISHFVVPALGRNCFPREVFWCFSGGRGDAPAWT